MSRKRTDRTGSGSPRILLVDDDPELLSFLAEFLTFKGYFCERAADGFEALKAINAAEFNALITDIAMPKMDGIELIRQLNSIKPDLPKIIVSGEGQFKDAIAAIGESVFYYFTKPITDFDEFDRVVRRAIVQNRFASERNDLQRRLADAEAELHRLQTDRREESSRLEQRYRTLFESGADAVLLLDQAGVVTDVNQMACRLLGLTRKELVGGIPEDELPTGQERLFFHQIHSTSRHAPEFHYETGFTTRDGTARQFEINGAAIGGANGELVVYIRDVTEQSRRFQILKTRNNQLLAALSDRGEPTRLNAGSLNNIMQTANAFIFIADLDLNVLEWNKSAEKISGLSRNEAIGAGALSRIFPKFATQMEPLLTREVFQSGKEVEKVEAEILNCDHKHFTLSWNISPVYEAGKICAALAVGIDVTSEQRLRSELETYASQLEALISERTRELLQSQERFRNLFEGVRDAIFAAGPEGQLLEVNPAWLRLLGYASRSEVLGKHFLKDFAVEEREASEAMEKLAGKFFIEEHILKLRRKDGATVMVSLSISTQPTTGYESTAYEGIIRDVTRLHQLEQSLIEHTQNLESLVRERSAALAESEAKFRRLTENSLDVIYRIDIGAMRFDYLSPAIEAMTGFTTSRMMAMGPDGFITRIHPKEAPQILELWANLGGSHPSPQREFHFEYRFIRADGEVIWLSDNGVVVRSDDGSILAVEGVMHDVTQQKGAAVQLAEQASLLEQEVARRTTALAESEYRYRMLLSEAGDVIFTCDIEGKVIEINRRGEDLLGRNSFEINRSGLTNLLDETSRRRFNKAIMTCFKAGVKPEPFQIEYSSPRGSKLLLEIQSSPLIIDDRVVMTLQVARDLTSRRRAAQAIRTLKEFNEGIIRSMSEGIFIENDDGVCEFVNPAMSEMLGYSIAELEGRHYLEMISPADRDYVMNQSQIRRLRGFARYEAKLIAVDGAEVPVHISSRCRYEGEKIVGSLSVITDLRQAKEMERRQRFMERLLADERKLADIGMLASGIAHNISSPLMVISGYAQLLRAKSPDIKEYDVILSQIDKISEITRNMMAKSRSEKDKGVKPIDLNEVLQTELKFLEANLHYKSKVEKDFAFDPNVPKIVGVYSDFSQAFSNIINNALDAMFNRPLRRLRVRTKSSPAAIAIEIGDTGGGIPAEHLQRIFDPFFTTKPALADVKEGEPSGTGLGLSTSHQLIIQYGGKIEVDSEVGIGSTFRIAIPLTDRVVPTGGTFAPVSSIQSISAEALEAMKPERR